MKTLLLTSSGKFLLSHSLDVYLPMPLKQMRLAYITTASKKVHDASFVDRQRDGMSQLGWHFSEFDIASMSSGKIEQTLNQFDSVFVEGGNAYYLLHVVRQTGFEQILKKLLPKGFVYLSSSAGSYIAGTTIETATWTERGFDRFGVTDFTAMQLIPFAIKAHYTLEKRALYKENSKNFHVPYKILTDDQALLVHDDSITLLGEGSEIIF